MLKASNQIEQPFHNFGIFYAVSQVFRFVVCLIVKDWYNYIKAALIQDKIASFQE